MYGWTIGKAPLIIIDSAAKAEAALAAGMLVVAAAAPVALDASIETYRDAGAISQPRKREGKIVPGTGGNGYYNLEAGTETGLPAMVRGMSLCVHGPRKDGSGRDSTGTGATGPAVKSAADMIGGKAGAGSKAARKRGRKAAAQGKREAAAAS